MSALGLLLALLSGALAQQDFCPGSAVQAANAACLECAMSGTCATDARCRQATCCLARCYPACGGRTDGCEGVTCDCGDDGEPDLDWLVTVGAGAAGLMALGLSLAAAARALGRRREAHEKLPPRYAPKRPAKAPEEEAEPPEVLRYLLQLSAARLDLHVRHAAELRVTCWRVDRHGGVHPAEEAELQIHAPSPERLLELEMEGPAWDRTLRLRVHRARGRELARHTSAGPIRVPEDVELELPQELEILARTPGSGVQHTVRVDVHLLRWFPICDEAWTAFPLEVNQLGQETHLRMDLATVQASFVEGLERFEREARREVRVVDVSLPTQVDKSRAGVFMFAHGPPRAIAEQFYLSDHLQRAEVERRVTPWLHSGMRGDPPKVEGGTEGALAVDLMVASKAGRLSPGDVFYHALRHTGGHVVGALLLAHNTLRALARVEGDATGTGLTGLGEPLFQEAFQPLRLGLRAIDGTDEERARGQLAPGRDPEGAPVFLRKSDLSLARENAGPWYHLFGTAFYEAYTAGRDGGGLPEQAREGWGAWANCAEQWYREYSPSSWQHPDPEKYCVNRWGIAVAQHIARIRP